mmetsp:Transcript_28829/g.95851  ORF Transcript_28829/g.95851 Transcript_28829/m.95851 type:complete len:308 (-) Transcript_28829:9-932(-)
MAGATASETPVQKSHWCKRSSPVLDLGLTFALSCIMSLNNAIVRLATLTAISTLLVSLMMLPISKTRLELSSSLWSKSENIASIGIKPTNGGEAWPDSVAFTNSAELQAVFSKPSTESLKPWTASQPLNAVPAMRTAVMWRTAIFWRREQSWAFGLQHLQQVEQQHSGHRSRSSTDIAKVTPRYTIHLIVISSLATSMSWPCDSASVKMRNKTLSPPATLRSVLRALSRLMLPLNPPWQYCCARRSAISTDRISCSVTYADPYSAHVPTTSDRKTRRTSVAAMACQAPDAEGTVRGGVLRGWGRNKL